MRIFIYGECDEYGSGAWCYRQTLLDMGHNVDFYSPAEKLGAYKQFVFKIIRKLNLGKPLPWHRKSHIGSFLERALAFRSEIVIVLKGLLVDEATVRTLRAAGSWIVNINHDDFFSLYPTSRSKVQFEAIHAYDFVFPTKEVNVHELSARNPNIEFFPFSYYPKIHKPPSQSVNTKRFSCDIVFIGSRYPERTRQLEYLVKNMPKDVSLKIFGNGWSSLARSSPLWKYIHAKILDPEQMCYEIFHSKISLGFLCKENRDDYTQRTFEIPAAKGVFLAERTLRHQTYYKEGVEAEFFDSDNYPEMVRKVKALLSDTTRRENMRECGHAAVLNGNHTYRDRLERLLELYLQRPRTTI